MIDIDIPGFGRIELVCLALDFNGTLALDGKPVDGVAERIERLAGVLDVYVLTADNYGGVSREIAGLPCEIEILPPGKEAEAKEAFIRGLGADKCAAIGNGANDVLMLEAARVGIAVIGPEGVARGAAAAADILAASPLDALDLLLRPMRLKATLRR